MPAKPTSKSKSTSKSMPNQGKNINVGVIGTGYWGPNIIRNLNQNPLFNLHYVCDRDQDRLDAIQSSVPTSVTCCTDSTVLINDDDLDAIAIVTDIPSHFNLAKQALEAGKHVFVEKPLCETASECEVLGTLADTNKLTLMVGHTFVYNSAVEKLKDILDSGELGETYYLDAARLNLGRVQTSTNALWSLSVHDVSIALYLFNEFPNSIRCWGHDFITQGVEDVTYLNMTFPSGRMATLHASWLHPEKERRVTLVGSKKMAIYDDVSLDQKIMIYDKGVDKKLMDNKQVEYKDFSGFQLLTRTGDIRIPHLNFSEPLKVEMQHFGHCILDNKIPKTDWKSAYEVVRILEAAQESLKNNGSVIRFK